MKRLRFEFVESCRIAYAQISANRTRSFLTALGVIIGIVAVTLMGTAIGGINTGFNQSMALLGDDILYVSKVPWTSDQDDWRFRNRRDIQSDYAERLQTIIDGTRNSLLLQAVPTANTFKNVLHGDYQASGRLHPRHDRRVREHHHGGLPRGPLLQRPGEPGRAQRVRARLRRGRRAVPRSVLPGPDRQDGQPGVPRGGGVRAAGQLPGAVQLR